MDKKERAREGHLRRTYGIGIQEYDKMLTDQGGRCFICQRPEEVFSTRLAVDHDHNTGEIRGLLCSHCNHRVIGRHRNPEILLRAGTYLTPPFTGWFVPKKVKRRRKR